MSKKKSLGSSPIGFTSKDNSMGFIPDLGVSTSKKKVPASEINKPQKKLTNSSQESKTEKKIVSYNLEVDLIDKVKSIASQKEMYYSSLVSTALRSWIAENS